MIPSKTWFSTTLQERAAQYANFNTQAQATGLTLGLVQADLDQIKDDNATMQLLADSAVPLDTYDKAWTAYRREITQGDIGDPVVAMPANIAFAVPTVVPTGIFERLNNYRTVIVGALNYTPETGAIYGIEGTTASRPSPDSVKPTIQVSGAETGYLFGVLVANRVESDMWDVSILKKGAANWATAKTATGKSADVTITPTTPGEPEQIQVRVQLKKNNANYGQLSDTVYVTINP